MDLTAAAGKKLRFQVRVRRCFSSANLASLVYVQINVALEYCSQICGTAAPTFLRSIQVAANLVPTIRIRRGRIVDLKQTAINVPQETDLMSTLVISVQFTSRRNYKIQALTLHRFQSSTSGILDLS